MKKFFKALTLITAAVMTATICFAFNVSAASIVETAEESVVLIKGDSFRGSGFAIGNDGENPKYIVTNCHVITTNGEATGNVSNEIMVFFSEAANKQMRAELIAADVAKDICILELPESTSERKPIKLCKSDNVSIGEEAYVLGYPDYGEAGKAYQAFDISDIMASKGSISQKTRVNNSSAIGTNVYFTDATVSQGNSGGPLINANGEAVGINTWNIVSKDENGDTVTKTTGGYAVMVDELIPLLNSNNIPYTLAGGSALTDEDADTEPVGVTDNSGDNTVMILIIVLAAVVVIAVVVIIVVVSKKKPAAPYQPGQQGSIPAPAPRVAVITGMKGTMANKSFNINGSIVIGRNPQKCNVCFPVDAKGISGVHCQIRQTAYGYEIMDCGSSNGTFLGNGQKLSPNVPVPIPDGTYFYLGSAEQLFQIKY